MDDDLDPQTSRRFLEIAREEAMRVGRLVDGMFDVSMLDLRSGSARVESSDVVPAISKAVDAVVPLAATRGVSIAQLSGDRFLVAVTADRLTQILINILENAIKHGREEGRIYVSVVALDGRYVEIRVDDDGPGVPCADREAIFDLARRGTNVRAQGSGVGLAVVRLMTERIGGEVDVTESVMGGAQFRVRLPLTDGLFESAGEPAPTPEQKSLRA